MNWCNSSGDSIVWMEEDVFIYSFVYLNAPRGFSLGTFFWWIYEGMMIYEFNKETNYDCDLKCDGNGFKLIDTISNCTSRIFSKLRSKRYHYCDCRIYLWSYDIFYYESIVFVFRNRIPWRKLIRCFDECDFNLYIRMCCSLHL